MAFEPMRRNMTMKNVAGFQGLDCGMGTEKGLVLGMVVAVIVVAVVVVVVF